jgi:hypothetical protein
MAAKSQAAKAGGAISAAYANPYVRRLAQDPALRDELRTAVDAGRSAYARLSSGKGPARTVIEDKKFQKDLAQASDSLRTVSEGLRQGPKRKRRGLGLGRLLVVALLGGGVALGASEGLRNKVLDLLFGAEEEFDYTSTTTPATTPVPEAPEATAGTVGT